MPVVGAPRLEKGSHSTKQPQGGSEDATAVWVAALLQPGVGSELSGCISYIQPQQPRVFTYIFPFSLFLFKGPQMSYMVSHK